MFWKIYILIRARTHAPTHARPHRKTLGPFFWCNTVTPFSFNGLSVTDPETGRNSVTDRASPERHSGVRHAFPCRGWKCDELARERFKAPDMCGSGGRHETVLGKMAAQGIDRLRALTNQTILGPVGDRGCLLGLGLYSHKPHSRPRLASAIASTSAISFCCRVTKASHRLAGSAAHRGRGHRSPGPNDVHWRKLPWPRCKAPVWS